MQPRVSLLCLGVSIYLFRRPRIQPQARPWPLKRPLQCGAPGAAKHSGRVFLFLEEGKRGNGISISRPSAVSVAGGRRPSISARFNAIVCDGGEIGGEAGG